MKANVLVDSYGWIEYFSGGRLAGKYEKYIGKADRAGYFTPSVVLYEVYKQVKRMQGEAAALKAAGYIIAYTTVVNLEKNLSLEAADISIKTGMGMADAIITATAKRANAKIITSDRHFRGMDGVEYIK